MAISSPGARSGAPVDTPPHWGWGSGRQLWACRLSHALGLVVVLGMLVIVSATPPPRNGQGTVAAAPARPNVLLIVADDMRADGLQAMPTMQALAAQGVTFTQAMAPTPLCCPSRASILTGQYAHRHGVLNNDSPHGGVGAFDASSTVATWLQAQGVRTGLVGRYLNGYDSLEIPPGWDSWFAFWQTDDSIDIYSDYDVNDQGERRHFGTEDDDYSTRVLGRQLRMFLAQQPERPFFALFTPRTPHGPAEPDPLDIGKYQGFPFPISPAYDEADISDKPSWVRENGPLRAGEEQQIAKLRRRQWEALAGLDREIAQTVEMLRADGRLASTWIIFTSDNGITLGEHRLDAGKACPYEACVHVPLVVVPPGGLPTPRADDHLVANIDLAPTVTAILRTEPASPVDGQSMLPLIDNPAAPWRDALILEQWHESPERCWSGVRTPTHKYVRYDNGDEELYDLAADPDELESLAHNPMFAEQRAALAGRLDVLLAR
ncbi:MAG: sulfatase [Chloroflexi bacterium]|nr:sulfatase [Chloroflexota bacterium]